MPQLTHTQTLAPAVAGMPGDTEFELVSFVAEEAIPFGRFVEWNATNKTVQLPKSTTLGNVVGVAAYPDMKTPLVGQPGPTNPYGYAKGEIVRVLRKGRVWVEAQGTAVADFARANIMHASTDGSGNAQHRGKATATATSATAGAEISLAPTAVVAFPPPSTNPAGLALVELNLPA